MFLSAGKIVSDNFRDLIKDKDNRLKLNEIFAGTKTQIKFRNCVFLF